MFLKADREKAKTLLNFFRSIRTISLHLSYTGVTNVLRQRITT